MLALNGYELPPQRHRAHGGLTEDSIILLPTRNSEEPKTASSSWLSLVVYVIAKSRTIFHNVNQIY